jgi:hypothetical protein
MFPCNVEAGQSLARTLCHGGAQPVGPTAHYSPLAALQPRWGEHRRERLARFHEPALLSRILLSRVEFVQSRLNGNTSDRGICDRFSLA